ncbi:hypothetical protein [Tsuneonella sp. HG222]
MFGSIWGWVTIAGPILLLVVVIWVWQRNRSASQGTVDRAERGARELREGLNREDTRGEQ